MSKVKVKPGFENIIIGFNNSSAPLGQRQDLHLLLRDAKYHKQKDLIEMFEDLSDDDIKEAQAEDFQNKLKDKSTTAKPDGEQSEQNGKQKPGSQGKAQS